MSLGVVIVCTNAYFILGIRFIKKFIHFYIGKKEIKFYLFTDTDPSLYAPTINNIKYIHTVHKHWQDGTNSKFKNILSLENEDCDYFFYFDADTNISRNFTEEWFIGDLVGGEHYNNSYMTNGIPSEKPYDRNPLSKAYIPNDTKLPQTYYYGAFFGGKKEYIMDFCKILCINQTEDKKISYEPVWNDESYINNYFHYNPPTFTVPARQFMFDISDKGGIGELRNTQLNIEKYKNTILNNNLQLFDFRNNEIVFYKLVKNGIMYGPWIAKENNVNSIQYLIGGEKVYLMVDGIHTKMVSQAGVAKYYTGTISDFKPENWHEYTYVGDNYRIKFFG
jgi:hypothetical protein